MIKSQVKPTRSCQCQLRSRSPSDLLKKTRNCSVPVAAFRGSTGNASHDLMNSDWTWRLGPALGLHSTDNPRIPLIGTPPVPVDTDCSPSRDGAGSALNFRPQGSAVPIAFPRFPGVGVSFKPNRTGRVAGTCWARLAMCCAPLATTFTACSRDGIGRSADR